MTASTGRAACAVGILLIVAAAPGPLSRARAAGAGGCSGRLQRAPLLLCDDFEDAGVQGRWEVGSMAGLWQPSEFVVCGEGVGYADRCAAWSNRLVFDAFWGFWGYDAWRQFPPRDAFYVRWYQYISDPYIWGTLEDKALLLHDGLNPSITTYVATSRDERPGVPDSGPGMPFVANYQDLDWPDTGGQYTKVNRFQNAGNDLILQPGRWYLFEWYVKLNTPGLSDGATRLWIDEASRPVMEQTLRLAYDDMRWLRSDDAGKTFRSLRLSVYHQRCDWTPNTCPPNGPPVLDQWQRWDHVAVSTGRIGPIDLSPVCTAAHAIVTRATRSSVALSIDGVADPRQQPVTITIDGVTPEDDDGRGNGRGRGHHRDRTGDVVVIGDTVLLPAGHGHKHDSIYRIDFTARNLDGLACTGSIRWP